MAVFKSYRVRFKSDATKILYRKKKLIFSLERRLSAFLKTEIEFKIFNPLDFTSMDDLWVNSLLDSLNFISHMYLRDRLDYKPAFVLSLYTMLAYKYNSPAFLGAYIANQLEWRWRKRSHKSFLRLLVYFIKGLNFNTIYSRNLVSFSVGFYGKVWGKLRAGKFIIRSAGIPSLALKRVSLKMDTSFTWAESQFGTFGIRIWIART